MTCYKCEDADDSYDGNPFVPPIPGGINNDIYACECGTNWWRFNSYFHLWTTVEDPDTWINVQEGCSEPVTVGKPALNISKLVREENHLSN